MTSVSLAVSKSFSLVLGFITVVVLFGQSLTPPHGFATIVFLTCPSPQTRQTLR